MRIPRPAIALALSIAAAASAGAVQQIVPRLPPPPTSIYDFLDLGPAPDVPCSCVPNAFALPAYRPGAGYGYGLATPLHDAPMQESNRRLNEEWYAQERQKLPRMAENGLAGNLYDSIGVAQQLDLYKVIVRQDEEVEAETVRWLALAAQQGHDAAYRLLAQRFAHGWGAKRDYAMAAYWFDQGARHDDPISMTAIGFLYAAGRGVEQNWKAAIYWWRRADGRNPLAARFLGDAYACGAGVEEDRKRADAAYRHGEDSCNVQRGHLYARCAGDHDGAIEAFRAAANQGFPEAQIELSGLMLERRQEPLEAYRWARMAEWRLPDGDMKTRAADLAAAAARLVPPIVLTYEDRMVKEIIASAAKPMR